MRLKKIFLAITVLVIAALACSVDVPITTDVKTGNTTADKIFVPAANGSSQETDVSLIFAAGDLFLSPGADGGLITGEASYNVDDLKPKVSIDNDQVKIQTGNLEIDGIPSFESKVENTWDLNFGSDPIDLTIKAGAYNGEFELGNLALTNLHIADGAANVNLEFSQPNRTEMRTLHYETGASDVSLAMLSNANFGTMIFESGAGNYDLDFSGTLLRDANIFIQTGLSSMTINIPEGMNASLTIEGGLANISTRGAWNQSGNLYSLSGDGPTLTFVIEMGAGNLVLRSD